MKMNYKELFDDLMREKYDNAPFSDDRAFIAAIKERTSIMEKKKHNIRKPAVIAVSLAAAAALTVSVGAAMNWDIAALFVNATADDRSEHSEYADKNIRQYYESGDYALRSVSADIEYEMLQSITHEIDRSFNVAGYDVHFTGYAYDGNWFELLYEVKFDKGVPSESGNRFPVAIATASDDERFESPGWITKIAGISENTIEYRSYHDIAFPEDINIRLFAIEDNEHLTAYINGMDYESDNYVDIMLTGTNNYSYNADTDAITADGAITIKNVCITPLGIVLKGAGSDENNGLDITQPLLVVFKDGTVTDITGSMGESDQTDDGMYEFKYSYYSNGILLDAREITELRIGDAVIPINQ